MRRPRTHQGRNTSSALPLVRAAMRPADPRWPVSEEVAALNISSAQSVTAWTSNSAGPIAVGPLEHRSWPRVAHRQLTPFKRGELDADETLDDQHAARCVIVPVRDSPAGTSMHHASPRSRSVTSDGRPQSTARERVVAGWIRREPNAGELQRPGRLQVLDGDLRLSVDSGSVRFRLPLPKTKEATPVDLTGEGGPRSGAAAATGRQCPASRIAGS
jgi:hypothetical protein